MLFWSLFVNSITQRCSGVFNHLPNIINKQAGSLMTWSAKRISSTIAQRVFPWELHKYWIKIKCISLQNEKQGLNQLPEGKTNHTMNSLPLWMQQKSKVGGLQHKFSTIISSGYTNNIVALIYLESLSHLYTAATAATQGRE